MATSFQESDDDELEFELTKIVPSDSNSNSNLNKSAIQFSNNHRLMVAEVSDSSDSGLLLSSSSASSSTVTTANKTMTSVSSIESSCLPSPSVKTTPLTRILLEWIFSLRHELVQSKRLATRLQLENEQLKEKSGSELMQFLGQLQRDAQKVTKALRAKDERIATLKTECGRLQAENNLLRRQMEFVLASASSSHAVLMPGHESGGLIVPNASFWPAAKSPSAITSDSMAASIVALSPTSPSTMAALPSVLSSSSSHEITTTSRSSVIASTNATAAPSSGKKFGDKIMSSLKKRLGTLSSSTRKLKSEHREKFRSTDAIAGNIKPETCRMSVASITQFEECDELEQERVREPLMTAANSVVTTTRTTAIVAPTTQPEKLALDVQRLAPPVLNTEAIGSSTATINSSMSSNLNNTNSNSTASIANDNNSSRSSRNSTTSSRLAAKDRRKNRVSISDPPAVSDCIEAAAAIDNSSYVAKSCGDINSLAEEDEIENSVSPLGMLSVSQSCPFEDTDSSCLNEERENDAASPPEDNPQPFRQQGNGDEELDDVNRCLGTRARRYSRRNFNFQRRYSSTYLMKSSSLTNSHSSDNANSLSTEAITDDAHFVTSAMCGPHQGAQVQLVRSRSSPAEAIEHISKKLRSKQQQMLTAARQHEEDSSDDATIRTSTTNHKQNEAGSSSAATPTTSSAPDNTSSNTESVGNPPLYQTSPRMVGSHSFAGREVLVV